MKITYLSSAQANIVIKTRNEHCEPHVHAYNVQQNWEFKVYFSFISVTPPAMVGRLFKVIAGKPSKRQLEEVVNEVYLNLHRYRRAWWSVVGKACLSNQYVVLVDGFLMEAMPGTSGAVRVHSASFNPSTAEIQFDFFPHGSRGAKISGSAKCPVLEA
jgi:hypothetical protein